MAKRYSIEELVRLRDSRPRGILLPLGPETAEIVRGRGIDSTQPTYKPATSSKPKNDSSESSDEILFKGNRDRRANREASRQAAPRQTATPQLAIQDAVHTHEAERELVRRDRAHESARDPGQNPGPTGWKYRGRSDSETGVVEPMPGPAGVPAQKNEGFQRFYKAVISPTHVRVTAGGRIVPNTRGPPSPTSKRTKDDSAMEAQGSRDQTTQPTSVGPMPMQQPFAVWPQLVHGFPANVQTLQGLQGSVSVIPMQYGHQLAPNYSFPSLITQPMMNQQSVLQPTVPQPAAGQTAVGRGAAAEANNTVGGGARGENAPTSEPQDKIKITPPENFDRTKPFYLNGQLVYPVPSGFPGQMGNPIMPIQMVGIPGMNPNLNPGMATPYSGSMMQAPGTAQIIAGPFPPGQTFTSMPTMTGRIAPVNGNQVHTAPPASSIKKSEVTKKQIGTLKSSIKWCEDQLQYNRFQIDEDQMRETMRQFDAERRLFEARYQAEVAEEEAAARSAADKNKAIQKETKTNHESSGDNLSAEPLGTLQLNKEMDRLDTVGQQMTGQSTKAPKVDLAHKQWVPVFGGRDRLSATVSPRQQYCEDLMESKKPGLPVDAALAPPFMPRAFTGEVGERSLESREAASEYFGTRKRHESRDSIRGKLEVPYLLGALPSGINPRTARDQDYVYNRPLTDDEVRARYLYWGKAPKSVMQGLPKFDGKHFYPPSPVKEDATLSDDGLTVRRASSSRRPINYDFRGTKSDCDPFRPMTPTQQYDSSKAMFISEDGYTSGRHGRTTSMETEIYIPTEDKAKGCQPEPGKFGVSTGVPVTSEEGSSFMSGSTNEKRSEKGALWPKLKKSTTSMALSSTTAQGYLPQYSGYAAASLSPSMNKNLTSPIRETVPGKPLGLGDRIDGGSLLSPAAEKRGENLPPNPVSSIDDQTKHISLADPHHHDVGTTFKV